MCTNQGKLLNSTLSFSKSEDTSDDEVNGSNVKKKKEVEDVDLYVKTEIEDDLDGKAKVKGKSRVKRDKIRGGSFDEFSTEGDNDDDHKFRQKVVNEVKENGAPEEDPVIRENRSHYKDALGNILLVMRFQKYS